MLIFASASFCLPVAGGRHQEAYVCTWTEDAHTHERSTRFRIAPGRKIVGQ
jgi:hypothetical protein